jgi:FixJ family two-component response regulator
MVVDSRSRIVAIVDDDESLRSAMQGLFKSVGVQAKVFASAEEFLKSGEKHLTGCLITDMRMPGMSGLELQARLISENCRIPTIFVSAHGDANMRSQALRAGALGFMSKPFDNDVLLEHVATALDA